MTRLASALALLLVACTPVVSVLPSPAPSMAASPAPHTVCQSPKPGLPDPICTPGAIDTRVTQDNIHSTICIPGYTSTVRPSTSFTEPIKHERLMAYNIPQASIRLYELDHLVPLEVGGNPSLTDNLWPEILDGLTGARVKDRTENAAHLAVCTGRMPLADAQAGFMTDWEALAVRLGVN